MQKNYFTKNLMAAMMLLAVSMSITSCQGLVDAVLGTEDNPVQKPETKPTTEEDASVVITSEGTTITISSLDELASSFSAADNEKFFQAIEASAKAGKEYVITIKSDASLSTADINNFVIPKVKGADINLVFEKALVTSKEKPLKITADEVPDASTEAVNKLTITMPDGSKDIYLSINLPETTVTLEGNVTYLYVESITALNTLYVESGVTIEEILVKGGFVVVKDGGSILTYVYNGKADYCGDKHIDIVYDPNVASYTGVAPLWLLYDANTIHPEIMSKEIDDNPYFCKYLKVIDVTADDNVEINWNNDVLKPLEKMTIGDGVSVTSWRMNAKNIIGEGTARFVLLGYANENTRWIWDNEQQQSVPVQRNELWAGMPAVEYVSNVIITSKNTNENITEYYSYLDDAPANLENCTIQFDNIYFGNMDNWPLKNGSVVKGCKFERTGNDDGINIRVPYQTGDKFGITFVSCDFAEGTKLYTNISDRKYDYSVMGYTYNYYDDGGSQKWVASKDDIPADILDYSKGNWWDESKWEYVTYKGYTVLIGFDSCKLGGNTVTQKSDMFTEALSWGPEGVECKLVIDGTTYVGAWYKGEYKFFEEY
ncbi:MAG: hypothetical protein J5931_07725 [Prevotella sp.]|nr:hypothetical protein [Prevotella sp.]